MRSSDNLVESIVRRNPMQRAFLADAMSLMQPEERRDFEEYLSFCMSQGSTIDDLAESYHVVVKDTIREQIYFRRHGRYRYSRYDQVAQSVYLDPRYMKHYMYGLALSQFLWPSHATIRRFFHKRLSMATTGRHLEVGPGHGLFFLAALRSGRFSSSQGVDLSPTSVQLTRQLIGSGRFGSFSSWSVDESDFLSASPEPGFTLIVMGEVLEHVENPELFLEKARALLAPDGQLFATTVINAPMVDHIFLYESLGPLLDQAKRAGLTVLDQVLVPQQGTTLQEALEQRLPVLVGLSCAASQG